jgi:DHA1 family bicyclomycin/chloramphenicol resistance-like MFS transporter
MGNGFARHAIVLGLLAAIGPFSIDMYLPALPTIAAEFGTSIAAAQASLVAFVAAVGLCQVVYGPVSDMVGRRGPLYFGLVLYICGAIGCALAPNIAALIAFRFVQGIGGCAGIVISRAIVRDLYRGADAARLMALVMLVFSVSPILAPLTGSGLIVVAGWRAIFVAVVLVGVVGLALVAFALPETRPPDKRVASGLRPAVAGYAHLLRDPYHLGVVLIGGFGLSGFFLFLATSSFVYIEHFGLTTAQFSLAFAVNAIGFIGAAQLSSPFARRFGFARVVKVAAAAYAAVMIALLALTIGGIDNLVVLMAMLFLSYACLGLIVPTTAVMAFEAHGPIAGMAAALMGTIHMSVGITAVALLSIFLDGSAAAMIAAITACAVCSFVLSRVTLRASAGYAQAAVGSDLRGKAESR